MMRTSIVFVAALSLGAFGCKKDGDGGGAGGGGDCEKAIAHSMELSKATMAKMPGFDDKLAGKMRDVGVQNCRADKWSAEAITCMTGAKSEGEVQGCYGKLTADQRTKMNNAAMALMTPPAAGSAAGSAAAGSAAAGSAAAGGW